MEARQGRGAGAGELDVVLASLVEGLRVLTVLLQPWLPATAEKLLAALGTPDTRSRRRSSGRAASAPSQPIEPLFPKQPTEPAAA